MSLVWCGLRLHCCEEGALFAGVTIMQAGQGFPDVLGVRRWHWHRARSLPAFLPTPYACVYSSSFPLGVLHQSVAWWPLCLEGPGWEKGGCVFSSCGSLAGGSLIRQRRAVCDSRTLSSQASLKACKP